MNVPKLVRQFRLLETKCAADGSVSISREEQTGCSAADVGLGAVCPLSHVLVHVDDNVGVQAVQFAVVMSLMQLTRQSIPVVESITDVVHSRQDSDTAAYAGYVCSMHVVMLPVALVLALDAQLRIL